MKKLLFGLITCLLITGCGPSKTETPTNSTPTSTAQDSGRKRVSITTAKPKQDSGNAITTSSQLNGQPAEEHVSQSNTGQNTASAEQSNTPTLGWSDAKTSQLVSAMDNWGTGEFYRVGPDSGSTDFYGLTIPDDLMAELMHLTFLTDPNDQNPDTPGYGIGWDFYSQGNANARYQVVAIYTNADNADYLYKVVYFFVLRDGEPIVYQSKQNQGNEFQNFYCYESPDSRIQDLFYQLLNE